jgi:hypothetical protein
VSSSRSRGSTAATTASADVSTRIEFDEGRLAGQNNPCLLWPQSHYLDAEKVKTVEWQLKRNNYSLRVVPGCWP